MINIYEAKIEFSFSVNEYVNEGKG